MMDTHVGEKEDEERGGALLARFVDTTLTYELRFISEHKSRYVTKPPYVCILTFKNDDGTRVRHNTFRLSVHFAGDDRTSRSESFGDSLRDAHPTCHLRMLRELEAELRAMLAGDRSASVLVLSHRVTWPGLRVAIESSYSEPRHDVFRTESFDDSHCTIPLTSPAATEFMNAVLQWMLDRVVAAQPVITALLTSSSTTVLAKTATHVVEDVKKDECWPTAHLCIRDASFTHACRIHHGFAGEARTSAYGVTRRRYVTDIKQLHPAQHLKTLQEWEGALIKMAEGAFASLYLYDISVEICVDGTGFWVDDVHLPLDSPGAMALVVCFCHEMLKRIRAAQVVVRRGFLPRTRYGIAATLQAMEMLED